MSFIEKDEFTGSFPPLWQQTRVPRECWNELQRDEEDWLAAFNQKTGLDPKTALAQVLSCYSRTIPAPDKIIRQALEKEYRQYHRLSRESDWQQEQVFINPIPCA